MFGRSLQFANGVRASHKQGASATKPAGLSVSSEDRTRSGSRLHVQHFGWLGTFACIQFGCDDT